MTEDETMTEYLEDPSWLSGEHQDQGINFCYECATKVRDEIGGHCIVDGGWPTEDDEPIECDICHVPLATTLMDGTEIGTREQYDKAMAKLGLD